MIAIAGGMMTAINSEITARSGEKTVLRLEQTEKEQKEKIQAAVEQNQAKRRAAEIAKSRASRETTLMSGPRGRSDATMGSSSAALRLPRAPMRNTNQKSTTSPTTTGKSNVPKVGQVGLGNKRSISTSAVRLGLWPFSRNATPPVQKEEYEREGMSASTKAAVRTDFIGMVMRLGSVGFVCIASMTPSVRTYCLE